jgi:MFS superfamily sulfate permease-like transporter
VSPAASWQPRRIGADLIAGVTLAAYAIPVSLAYAGLAGLPPEVGVYGYLLGGLGYALLGSSRQLAVGPTSAISLMVGATVAQMAGGDR